MYYDRCARLRPGRDKKKKESGEIAKKSAERWECVLRYGTNGHAVDYGSIGQVPRTAV